MKTKSGSKEAKELRTRRVTQGRFLHSGDVFEVMDSWKNPEAAHRDLGREWIGTTTFIRSSPGSKSIGAAGIAPAADGREIMPRGDWI